MGFRFQKRIGVAPGTRVNLSKTGVSASVGGKGATLNVGKNGPMVTLGIPGTGLSYRMQLGAGTIVLGLLLVLAVVGGAYYLQPQVVQAALHWWQPKWF